MPLTLSTVERLLLKAVLFASTAMLVLMAFATKAHAAGELVAPRTDEVVTMNLALVTIIGGTILPVAHGLITKLGAASRVNVLVGLVLSGVSGVLGTATEMNGVAVFSRTTLVAAALTWVAQVATYYGVWKPSGFYAKLAPNVGIG